MAKLLTIIVLITAGWIFSARAMLITNVNIIDIKSGKIIEQSQLAIKQGKFVEINKLNRDFATIDANNGYAIPGLIDMHVHATAGSLPQIRQQLQNALENGIVAVRDMGGNGQQLSKLQENETEWQLPKIYSSAVFAGRDWMENDFRAKASTTSNKPGSDPWLKLIDSQTDINLAVKSARLFGVHAIKLYADIPASQLQAIVELAQLAGLKVWAHATLYPVDPIKIIDSGVNVISHTEHLISGLSSNIPKNYRLAKNAVNSQQTIADIEPTLRTIADKMKRQDAFLDPTLYTTYLRANQYERINLETLELTLAVTKRLHELGVKLVAGTDMLADRETNQPNLIKELTLFVNELEMTPLEALQTATINAASALGLSNQMGQISLGLDANFVLLNQNPLSNIANINSISMVFKHGQQIK